MDTTIALPPRSSRRNRRVCAVMPYDGQQRPKLDKQYRARSYSEMMETKDTCERLALYEKTFELCMRADPQLTAWIKRVKQKGVPKAMTEGYKPRRSESSSASSDNSSTSSRRSFSVFLRKASALPSNPRGCSSSLPPDPLKSSASRFIATSISKLSSLSRQPHHHHQQQQPAQQPRRSYDRSTSIVPSASAKIKRRLSSQHQRLFSSTTSSTRTTPSSNNTTSTVPPKKSPEPPATHSVFLDRLRLRRSHEPMVGVDITHHANKIIAVRV